MARRSRWVNRFSRFVYILQMSTYLSSIVGVFDIQKKNRGRRADGSHPESCSLFLCLRLRSLTCSFILFSLLSTFFLRVTCWSRLNVGAMEDDGVTASRSGESCSCRPLRCNQVTHLNLLSLNTPRKTACVCVCGQHIFVKPWLKVNSQKQITHFQSGTFWRNSFCFLSADDVFQMFYD